MKEIHKRTNIKKWSRDYYITESENINSYILLSMLSYITKRVLKREMYIIYLYILTCVYNNKKLIIVITFLFEFI